MNTERTSLFYMANLGSEVERIFSLKKRGMEEESKEAYARALNIIEKLISHRELSGRTGEIKLLKNYLGESIKNLQDQVIQEEWRNYFMPYVTRLLAVV